MTAHGVEKPTKKAKKARKKKQATGASKEAAAAHAADSPEADLRARIAALEAENTQLRSTPGASTAGDPAPATVTKNSSDGGDAAAAAEDVDMSAWDDYGLDELVVRALAAQAFSSPTAIQHECLPAAVLGNADIIGAAQTVRPHLFVDDCLCEFWLA